MESGYWKFGSWKGIPFYYHWSLLLWMPWYWWTHSSVLWAGITFLAFISLVLAHELGHAWAARARRTRVYAIRLFALHGQCEHEIPHYEADHIFIAWGGVLAQACLLVIALVAQYVLQQAALPIAYLLAPLFFVFIKANLFMGLFNLIPIAPLDGHVACRVVPRAVNNIRPRFKQTVRAWRVRLDVKARWGAGRVARRTTADLMERLRKKSDQQVRRPEENDIQ